MNQRRTASGQFPSDPSLRTAAPFALAKAVPRVSDVRPVQLRDRLKALHNEAYARGVEECIRLGISKRELARRAGVEWHTFRDWLDRPAVPAWAPWALPSDGRSVYLGHMLQNGSANNSPRVVNAR